MLGSVLVLAACSGSPAAPEVDLVGQRLRVEAAEGLERVTVLDASGLPLVRRRLPAPVEHLEVEVPWTEAAPFEVRLQVDGEDFVQVLERGPVLGPVALELQAPVGQGSRPVDHGELVAVHVIGQAPAQVALTVFAQEPGDVLARLGDQEVARQDLRVGERIVVLARIQEATDGYVEHAGGEVRFRVVLRRVSLAEARQELVLEDVHFPAESSGEVDASRPVDRITLPSPWWQAVLRRTSLGFRARDTSVPWAWQGVRLTNHGDAPLNLVLRSRVVGTEGEPDLAFRPTMRDVDDGTGLVSVLLRVPAGAEVVGSVPLYLDELALGDGPWTRQLEIAPVGSSEVVHRWEAPLYVSRGSTATSLALGITILASLAGAGLIWRRGGTWLRRIPTSQLMTIALFGSMAFVVSAVGRLVTVSVAAVLGPFAPLLTGLFDDAFRITLLATLVTLVPRPGTATLAVLVQWLLSGIALGSFSPIDVFFVTSRIAWLEGFLWVAGITRETGWLEDPPARQWLRLGVGFAGAGAFTAATALVLSIVLYRLFIAPWYAVLVIGGPGFVYVLLACGLAVPFAASLRRVAP